MAYTTIDDPSAYFQVHYWVGTSTGDGVSQTLDGNSDLQPDFVWHKHNGASNHGLFTSSLIANDDATTTATIASSGRYQAPFTNAGGSDFSSFDSDGFTLDSSSQIDTATSNGNATVDWCWKANGGTRTTNTESGDNPAGGYQANTTAGFSIIDYTGTGAVGTMAHGLGVAPDFIMIKNRDAGDAWAVYHSKNTGAPETDYLVLNETAATVDDAAYWNDTSPTSSVFTINTVHNVNANGEKYIAWAWTSIQGYSKLGSYEGNGDGTDGTFVHTGFKPAWLMVKNIDASEAWTIIDNKRNAYNPLNLRFVANTYTAQSDEGDMDFVSNGFKCRNNGGDWNTSNNTYIYMAFAEQPFVTSTGIPATAR